MASETNPRPDCQGAFCVALNALMPGWRVEGNQILGLDGAAVRLHEHHEATHDDHTTSPGHVVVEFVLDDARSLWDCVSGPGDTPDARARAAAHLWSNTSGAALLELKSSRQGEFADHYPAGDPLGFPGWHMIAGGILGYGVGSAPHELQKWWLANPLLPLLSNAITDPDFAETSPPIGIKIFFGGNDTAEVRVNGVGHEAASALLASLDWPRVEPPGFVRSYFVLVDR